MFGNTPLSSPLSLSKIVGGLSKTLGIANQIIPIYKEARPMIQNARNALNLVKEFSNSTTTRIQNNTQKNLKPLKEKVELIKNINANENKKGPTFFV